MKYQVMRPLNPVERGSLLSSIQQYGITQPIAVDEDGEIIDGHHRSEIAKELGIECPTHVRAGLDEEQKRELAWQLNLTGRVLTKQQREESWAKMRAEGMSYRQIAEADGTAHFTTVQKNLSGVENSTATQPETVTGKDGKKYKATAWSWKAIAKEEGLQATSKTQKALREIDSTPGLFSQQGEAQLREACRALINAKQGIELKKIEEEAESNQPDHKESKAVKAHKRLLDIQFEQRVRDKLDEILPSYKREYETYRRVNDAFKGPLPTLEYKLVLACLHPDRAPPDRSDQFTKAFHAIKSKQDILCGTLPRADETSLPGSVAELMANRRR